MRIRHLIWNLLGLGLPLVMALYAIPGLLALIGAERFGFLALAWGLIGYAGAMDLGIGRATTQRVSGLRNTVEENQIPDVVATAIKITTLTGAVGMLAIASAALLGAPALIRATSVPVGEIRLSMLLLALALPLQAIAATYRGVNEAYLNFGGINILRTFLGAANFGAPFLVANYTDDISWLVSTLVSSRLIALVLYRSLAHRCMRVSTGHDIGRYSAQHAHTLLRFGGWFSVSSLISPLMVQSDRFFVGAMISAGAVTLYVIPYEVTTQALILVGALTAVIFPVISNLIKTDAVQAMELFRKWLFRIVVLNIFALSLLAFVMPTLLSIWVGKHVSVESIRIGQILCLGVMFNVVGSMYFALLHARGMVKQTALLHMFEFPVYLLILVKLITWYGITGCAFAWVARTAIDALALYWISQKSVVLVQKH